MDPLSAAILVFLVFIAYNQGVLFIAIGLLIIYLIISRDLWGFIIASGGIGAIEILEIKEYWFVVLAAVVAIILLKEKLKSKKSSSSDILSLLDSY